ncbi:MAG: hydroxysqualene dehydroxylase HpnE [Zoogloeaceae bacterium]|jgi:squalene-associated FAD-dependent desaturase|nr:hydroxysqualene dehydroxylase HpnE [Zoogloeaceae bacterium]
MSDALAIVGGGWAGIAAAVAWVRRHGGAGVHLFDAGKRLGGRARAAEHHPTFGELDEGQHLLSGAYTETLALMRQIGIAPETVLQRLPLTLMDDAGFRLALPRLPAPLHLAAGLLLARGVGWREKIRALALGATLRRARIPLEEDVSVDRWLTARGQHGAFNTHLWRPLCLAALNTPAERASARVFLNVLRDGIASRAPGATDLLLPRASLSRLLPDPAAAWLQQAGVTLHTGTRIRALQASADGWRLTSTDGSWTCARLILAVAPQHLAALLPEGETPPALTCEPIATVYFQYPASATLPFPVFALAEREDGLSAWLIARGAGCIAAVLSGHGAWETLPKTELAARLHTRITPLLGLTPRACPEHRILIARRATFSCAPGLPRHPMLSRQPRLWLAGDHIWADYPATLEGAVRSGRAAGEAAAADRDNPASP